MLITILELKPLARGGLWALVEYRDGERTLLHQHHCVPADWMSMESGARNWQRSIERTGERLLASGAASEPASPLRMFELAAVDAYRWLDHPALAPLRNLSWEVE